MGSFTRWIENNAQVIDRQAVYTALTNLSYIGNSYANMNIPSHLHKDINILWQSFGNTALKTTLSRLSQELQQVEYFIGNKTGNMQADFQNPDLKEALRRFHLFLGQVNEFVKSQWG